MKKTMVPYDRNMSPRHCYNCQKIFWVEPYEIKVGRGKYCSRECMWEFGVAIKSPTKGKPCSDQRRKRCSESQLQSRHWNWCGGVSKERNKVTDTNEYRHWRKSVFERDNYTCALCGVRGGKLNAHHIIPFSEDRELWFNQDNGITLCLECHWIVYRTKFCPLPKNVSYQTGYKHSDAFEYKRL